MYLKIDGRFANLLTDENGNYRLSFIIDKSMTNRLKKGVDGIKAAAEKGKDIIQITVEPKRKKRSLSANAYFHVLVNKIASVLEIGNEECKKNLNLEYGTAAAEGGDLIIVALPQAAEIENYYPYGKWIGDFTAKNNKPYSQYLLYKQTHTLDSKEMAKLIEGTIHEAKQLGIETMPPHELEALLKRWENEPSNNKGDAKF